MHESNGQVRFNLSLAIYFASILVAGLLAWGNLKGDVREFRAETQVRIANVERRLDRLEDRLPTEREHRRTATR